MMNQGRSIPEVVDKLLDISVARNTTLEDLQWIAEFLVNSGNYKDLFRQYPRRFFEKSDITWAHFLDLVVRFCPKVPPNVVNAVYKGCKENGTLDQLALSLSWTHIDLRVKELRRNLWQAKHKDIEKIRNLLKQKIEFFKTNRLIEDEKRSYQKYQEMFPTDDSIHSLYEDFKERQARNIISKKVEERKNREVSLEDSFTDDLIKTSVFEVIESECLSLLKLHPKRAYDLSLLFIFIEGFDAALKMLEFAPEAENVDWLKIELLLLTKDYFSAFTEVEKLEEKYRHHSEIVFSLTYLKAKIYMFLDQKLHAANLFKSIIRIRPNYREASALLREILEDTE